MNIQRPTPNERPPTASRRAEARRAISRQNSLHYDVQQSLEDTAMLRAIRAGEKSKAVSRHKIFQRLARAE